VGGRSCDGKLTGKRIPSASGSRTKAGLPSRVEPCWTKGKKVVVKWFHYEKRSPGRGSGSISRRSTAESRRKNWKHLLLTNKKEKKSDDCPAGKKGEDRLGGKKKYPFVRRVVQAREKATPRIFNGK